jgi:ABC-type glycerol-3-phosphate transport system substrate-binding protein
MASVYPDRRSTLSALWLATALIGLSLVLAAVLAGCRGAPAMPTPETGDSPASSVAIATAPPAPLAAQLITATPATGPSSPSDGMTLTLWTTLAFSPTQAITGGRILAGELATFEATHPGVRLQVLLKEPYGAGGLLNSLLKTGPVVPELLPDLIVLDVNELAAAVEAGYLQPLDGLLPADLVADLYPFAREAATFDGRLFGLQYQADLDHLVYNTGKISLAPRSWPGVLSNPGPYLFPAGGRSGLADDALLAQYLAVREQTGVGQDRAFLDERSLATVLQFYYDALSRGIVPARIANYHSTDDYWNDYVGGEVALAQVSAHRYLQEKQRLPGSAVAAVPGMHGPARPISRGWALALVTADPARQAAAVDLMKQLLTPTANAAWNRAAATLPTRAAALPHWQPDDSYGLFISGQLQQARPRPSLPNYTQLAASLQEAVAAVLSGTATPEQAAAGAITPR